MGGAGEPRARPGRSRVSRPRRTVNVTAKEYDPVSQETFVVAYEGDEDGGLLDYAIKRAGKDGAKLIVAHILPWSPYSFLTPEELEERHGRRKQELERARKNLIDPALERVRAAGIEASCELRYGSIADLIAEIAQESGAALIFVGRSGTGSGFSARVFGSVPIALAQIAPVPTVIVP